MKPRDRQKGTIGIGMPFFFILYLYLIIVFLFYYFTVQEDIADYYSYKLILNEMAFYNLYLSSLYEIGSYTILYVSYLLAGSTHDAIIVSRVLTTVTFVLFLIIMRKFYRVDIIALVMVIALYGALLSFVTIRATPAYLLVTIATLEGIRGRWRSLFLGFIAIQFHISAVLALPLIFAALLQSRTNWFLYLEKSRSVLILFSSLIISIYLVFNQSVTDLLESIIDIIPFLNKYIVYLDTSGETSGSSGESQIYHFIYLGGCALLLLFAIAIKDKNTLKIRASLIIGFVIFIFLQFSPVTAFRFSLFWTIPLIFIIPWQKYLNNLFARAIAIIAGLAVFIVQLNSVTI